MPCVTIYTVNSQKSEKGVQTTNCYLFFSELNCMKGNKNNKK